MIDFIEMGPRRGGHKYFLVLIDTFTGWTEICITLTDSALIIAKKLLYEIVLQFGLPTSLGSYYGPAFITQITQNLAAVL